MMITASTCIPATMITFHKGSNLDLLLYRTLVNQQCKACNKEQE